MKWYHQSCIRKLSVIETHALSKTTFQHGLKKGFSDRQKVYHQKTYAKGNANGYTSRRKTMLEEMS